MNVNEFLNWLANYCRENNYGLSAASVCSIAEGKGVELGHIIQIGRKHLIPNGWVRHRTSGGSFYLPPEVKDRVKG